MPPDDTSSDTEVDLDALIEEITVDAYGDDEQAVGFLTAIEDEMHGRVFATVIGVPVELLAIDYTADTHRGLIAHCRREHETHVISALDIRVPNGSRLSHLLDAYRHWSSPDSTPTD